MTTMAVVTLEKSAPALVRWAARFERMRGDALTVFCCLMDNEPLLAPAPLEEHPELGHLTLLRFTLSARAVAHGVAPGSFCPAYRCQFC
jgi:hypothetical protein